MRHEKEKDLQTGEIDSGSEGQIRSLLEGAGKRPDIPQEDFHLIKTAARSEWQRLVDARKSDRRWWRSWAPLPAAAGIVLAVLLSVWWFIVPGRPAIDMVATVELIHGDVRVMEGSGTNAPQPTLSAGNPLAAGTELVTRRVDGGEAGMVSVRLANGQSLRLDSDTRARIASAARVELLEGALYFDSGKERSDLAAVEIATPFGSVFDVGTRFEVRVGDQAATLQVRVRSGEISLVRGVNTHSALSGEELRVEADGTVSRRACDPFASDWDWVLATAPAIDIEGLALSSFLEWAAHETGLEIRFEDEELAGAAKTIELHGTIEGLRPDEALVAVLPGTGLAQRLDDGTLVISRLPPA